MAYRKNLRKSRSKKSFIFYASLLSISCFLIISYQLLYSSYKVNSIDKIAYSFGFHTNVYAIIIDAGSTGSRVSAFSFYKSGFDGGLKLFDDLFVQNKPGLSSFADRPQEGAKKITELIERAKAFIPQEEWSKTPIALRATAGLRLLPSHKAETLLNEVSKIIKESPFLSGNDSVSIMDGKDEGLFSWFTVNFYMDYLNEAVSKSVVTLDLGGGSVQITFIPKSYKRLTNEAAKLLHPVSILQKKVNMYSYSYLGLGLMAARNKVFIIENSEKTTIVTSSCVHPSIQNKQWNYGGVTYTFRGNPKNTAGEVFAKCSQIIKVAIEEENVDKPPEIFDRDIVIFSYFFDRAAESGMIDRDVGGTVTTKDFKKTAEKFCSSENAQLPLMCLDLTFITFLLEHGFGIKPETPIQLVDTVDGHEISWSLGAGYSIVDDLHS